MMVRVQSSTVTGIDSIPVDVQVQVREGKQNFTIIGLADAAIREARDRVYSALSHLGFKMPSVILVNLAPAEIKKEGARFDLPIALGVLAAARALPRSMLEGKCFLGELSLDGQVKSVRGALSCALGVRERGMSTLVLPRENVGEASLVRDLEVVGVSSLRELVSWLSGGAPPQPVRVVPEQAPREAPDITEVWGQETAKRALVVAAAGRHNVLMVGPPGCGKSMLAQRFSSLLPPLQEVESLETARIHSSAGQPLRRILLGERPFRAPHHVISEVGLVGGGTHPRAGEISLAHHGVLFLDEFPEYRRSALEALRAPLEAGTVTIARASGSVTFPARFQLIAAMNPCPCGRLGARQANKKETCLCSRTSIQNYLKKLSQPILDRIDLQVELNPVPVERMLAPETAACEGVARALKAQIAEAQQRQSERQGMLNSMLSAKQLRAHLEIKPEAIALLEHASRRLGLTARGFVRMLRVAATVADLAGAPAIASAHVAEALSFRALSTIERYLSGESSVVPEARSAS
jgi:magnesium chelatase family protein